MLDPEFPPAAEEEGATDGVVDAVLIAADSAAAEAVNVSTAVFTMRPWTIVIAPQWAAAGKGNADAPAPALLHLMCRLSQSRCHNATTQTPGFSPSWMTFSSRPKFRRRRAS